MLNITNHLSIKYFLFIICGMSFTSAYSWSFDSRIKLGFCIDQMIPLKTNTQIYIKAVSAYYMKDDFMINEWSIYIPQGKTGVFCAINHRVISSDNYIYQDRSMTRASFDIGISDYLTPSERNSGLKPQYKLTSRSIHLMLPSGSIAALKMNNFNKNEFTLCKSKARCSNTASSGMYNYDEDVNFYEKIQERYIHYKVESS